MKKTLIILFLFTTINVVIAQDLKYECINVISNGIIGAIGSGINKHKNETFIHAFINGSMKGMIGGLTCYGAKKIINNNLNIVWPARFVHSLGTSIVNNASCNEKIFSSFTFPLYFTQITYNNHLHCKIDLGTLAYTIILFTNKNMQFDMNNSLKLGAIYFNKKYDSNLDSFILKNNSIDKHFGQTLGNTMYTKTQKTKVTEIIYKNNFFKDTKYYITETNHNEIILHEIIHSFQYFELNNINNFFKFKLLHNKYVNINLNMCALYGIHNLISGYNKNIFESEADEFSNYKEINHIIKYNYE